MPLEIKRIGVANLPDGARLCLAGHGLGDRPPAFTREVEMESTRCKLSLLRTAMAKGSTPLAAYRSGMLVGYLEAHPVEEALVPLEGTGYHVVTCLRVPEDAERAEVEYALVESLAATLPASRGLAVLARDKIWGPLGFRELDRDGSEVEAYDRVLWWRPISDDGSAGGDAGPSLAPVDRALPKIDGKIRVDLFVSDRCPWDRYVIGLVRDVCASMRDEVVVYETDCSKRREVLRSGVPVGVAINGRFQPWFRPYRLPDGNVIRRSLESAV